MLRSNYKLANRKFLLVSGIYFLLVLSLWIPFGLRSGMPYENIFPWWSETQSVIQAFFNWDPLRIHTNFFYHLSYLLSRAVGIRGSFLTYQIVYALLWWGRGALVFLICSKLMPQYPLFNYLIGSFVIVHASDHALNWVGQLNQFGMIFWMLLSFYMLVQSLQSYRGFRAVIHLGLSLIFVYMSLWSYESQLFIVLSVPMLLLLLLGSARKNLILIGAYYIVPVIYMLKSASHYLHSHGYIYQQTVLRNDFGLYAVWNDLWFNIGASLKFWTWAGAVPMRYAEQQSLLFPCATSTLFMVGALILKGSSKRGEDSPFPSFHDLWIVLIVGFILLAASFPAYLLLASARALWRTQFLSGIGTALSLGSVIGLLAVLTLRDSSKRFVVLFSFGAIVSFYGSAAALKAAAFHYDLWEKHRHVIAQVLRLAPKVKANTLIVLVGVPKDDDPLIHPMWFDMSVRLAYPGRMVSGLYFYTDGTQPAGSHLGLRAGRWETRDDGYLTLLSDVSISQTLFIQIDGNGCAQLLNSMPDFLRQKSWGQVYDSSALIEKGRPSERARRRYEGVDSILDKRCDESVTTK